MIHTTKIVIKGYPNQDINNSVYNMNDLMQKTTIIINDFPTFIMENFDLNLMGFYHFSKAKLKINVKPDCPARFILGLYDAKAATFMKLKTGINIKSGFYHVTRSKMLLKGNPRGKIYFKMCAKARYTLHPIAISKFAFTKARILENKAYTIRFDKIIGYWDDFLLGDMDKIINLELAGTLLD